MKKVAIVLLFLVVLFGAYICYTLWGTPKLGGYYVLKSYEGSGSVFFLDDKKIGAGSGACISLEKSPHTLALEKEGKRQEMRVSEEGTISAPTGQDLGFSVFLVEKTPKVEKEFGCK